MKVKAKKLIVILMVFMLMFSNFGYTLKAIATSEEFQVITKGFFRKDEIKFNAYFVDEDGNKTQEAISDVNNRIRLMLEVTPQVEGYLKDAIIRAVPSDGENTNFRFAEIKDVELEDVVYELNMDTDKLQEIGTNEKSIEMPDVEETETMSENVVEEDEELIDEEEMIEQVIQEAEEKNKLESDVEIISENEIKLSNVLENTTIEINLEFKQDTQINIEDLYKEIRLQMSGRYINYNLEEVDIGKESIVNIGWKYSNEIEIESEYTKYSPFKIGETAGTIVENKVIVRRETQKENYLPVRKTEIEIEVPEIEGNKPIQINVQANKLMATNGEDVENINFGNENWRYNEETGKIEIKVINEKNGYATNSMGEDEYIIVYRYDYYTEEEETSLNKNVTVMVEEYGAKENNKVTETINATQNVKTEIGELITYSIGTTEDKINKGKINANYNSPDVEYETEYINTIHVNILTSDMLEELKIESNKEYYIDNNGLEFQATGIKTKKIKFQYNEIKSMLEKEGTVEIYTANGELLYTLNNELIQKEEDCTIEIADVTGVIIYVKGIVENGTITIELTKAIGRCDYEKAAFKNFIALESRVVAEVKYESIEEKIELQEIGTKKTLEESNTTANISINKESLATLKENENVEIKIELNNNEENRDLYKNPCFEIVFPKYVKEVNVESVNLLYEEGLNVKNVDVYTIHDIVKVKIELEGTQTRFVESDMTNGTNIIINSKIILNEYTPRKQDQIKLYYYNEGVTNYESQTKWTINKSVPVGIIRATNGFDVAVVNYQAPVGLIAINSIKNYDGNLSEIKSIRQGDVTKRLERGKNSQISTMEILTLNNTGNECTDVVLLGRMPFKGNTDVITNEDLGATIDVQIKDLIKSDLQNSNNATIYYSTNGRANKNLNDSSNGWTTHVEDINSIKSYLIVIDGTVAAGEVLRYTYDFEIPEDLPYEVKIIGSFGAYYNNNTEVAIVYESSIADRVSLTTEPGPKIEANMTVDIGDGASVLEDRRIKYTIMVANTGGVVAEDVVVRNSIPEYVNYTTKPQEDAGREWDYGYEISYSKRELEFTISKLEPGEVEEFSYFVTTKQIPTLLEYASNLGPVGEDEGGVFYSTYTFIEQEVEEEDEFGLINKYTKLVEQEEKHYITEIPDIYIINKATVSVGNLAINSETNEVKNLLIKANFSSKFTIEFDRQISIGMESDFKLLLKNISGKDLKNVQAVFNTEKELQYSSATLRGSQDNIRYDGQEEKVYFNIGSMEQDEIIEINVKLIACNISDGIKLIPCYFELNADNIGTEVSTVIPQYIIKSFLEAELITNPTPKGIEETETIDIQVKIKNIGKDFNKESLFECEVPNALNVEYVQYSGDKIGGMSTGNGMGKISNVIPILKPDESIIVNINLKAKNLPGIDSTKIVIQPIIKNAYQEDVVVEKTEFNIANTLKTPDELEEERLEEIKKEEEKQKTTEEEKLDNSTSNEEQPNNDFPTDNTVESDDSIPTVETPTNNTVQPNNIPIVENEQDVPHNNDNTIPSPIQQVETYNISGVVWLDENRNGQKDEEEKVLAGIKIQLYKAGNMIKATTSDGNGKYIFDELNNGKYSVVFEYDKELYATSTYMKAGVSNEVNSKALENESGKAASNSITILNANVENINLGLQAKDVFDLSVSKYITKATVTTGSKMKEYKYEDTKLAKVEISAKDLKVSTVEIEYKIVIENTGSVTGNATQIVDHLPNGITFDKNKNTDWYLGNDGKLYYDKLKEIKIEAGQKKEIKLVLTKKMTEENTGVVSNKVEIKETLNLSGLTEDANGNSTTQELIISVKTGEEIKIIVLMAIIGVMTAIILKQRAIIIELLKNNKLYKAKSKKTKISTKKFYK